jgi:endonuclease I
MQAHVASDEGKEAYTAYINEQNAYYTGDYTYNLLIALSGDALFGRINQLMGNTCKLNAWGLDYGDLRYAYVDVDRDLNRSGYIIGYYDGKQLDGDWGSGWNREHTWPQSKGAKKETTMGHDMQSVRPTNTSVNSSRGNDAYGEGGSYYDPDDEISISNSAYKPINLGTYRGDAARVILYDYLVYGEAGGNKNSLYNGNAQLLSKLGSSGVFESIHVLLKWHMQDPPSLTEMVRNDGAQDYQGNRNPIIDFPELAIEVFANYNKITRYNVTYHLTEEVSPRYLHTLSEGFITYLTCADGSHPAQVSVTGGKAEYDATLGRLIITNVTGDLTISTTTPTMDITASYTAQTDIYNIAGNLIVSTSNIQSTIGSLPAGMYIIRQGETTRKILIP